MLPIRIGGEQLNETLPPELIGYKPIIENCRKYLDMSELRNPLAYLTVDEGIVEAGSSHRRGRIHTDSPGKYVDTMINENHVSFYNGEGHHWGRGSFTVQGLNINDGIFLASNVDDSCRLWNCAVKPDFIENGGNCEHIRALFNRPDIQALSYVLKANKLWWITDKTPHESLPLSARVSRQFFRLVVGEIGVWFSKHSTANPRCSLPDTVQVIKTSKFENYKKKEKK